MATTCKLIAKNVLGSSSASITLSSIPGTFTDLMVLVSARTDRASLTYDGLYLHFNADSGSNMTSRTLRGNGAAASSFTSSASQKLDLDTSATGAGATTSTFGSVEIYIPNYGGSSNKSFSATTLMETNGTTAYIQAVAGLWSQTAAITSIAISPTNGTNLVSGTSVYLYGITKS